MAQVRRPQLVQVDGSAQALYIRTSTLDQSGAAQLHSLRRAAQARGWLQPREFIDLGHSGAKASRPALDELRRAVRAGEIRAVLIAGLDRLGRSLRDLLHLLDELTACGCTVVSLREGVDLSTPAGRLQVQILGALAEFERELIRERVRSGMQAAKDRGVHCGRPFADRALIEAGLRRVAAGERLSRVADELGVGASTIRRYRKSL